MKAEYLNPFLVSAIDVLEQFIEEIEIERGELSVVESPFPTRGAATYIGISGDLEGRVIYDMNRGTAVELAGAMNGEEFHGLNEMVRSTIRELANIISGNAGSRLNRTEEKLNIDITPPSLIIGDDTEISDSVTSPYLQVPLETNFGTIKVNLAVQKT